MSCIRCGDVTEESAYLCEVCASTLFQDPLFLFPPSIIGESIVERLRHQAAAMLRLGPVSGGDFERVEGQSFLDAIAAFDVKKASEKEAENYYKIANFVLSQYGIPPYSDKPKLSLTAEGSRVVAEVAQKINALSARYPTVMFSDVFLRIGLIYWSASRGVLMRAGPVKWCREKRKYTLLKSLEFLGKIPESDDLYSLALKMSGLILLDAGAYAYAEEKLSKARKSFPEDMVIVRALAKAHYHIGNVEEALSLIDLALSTSESADVWQEKGEYLKKLERQEEAIAAFEKAISLDRNYVRAYKSLIHLLKETGRLEEAEKKEADLKLAMEPGVAAKLDELLATEAVAPAEEAVARARKEPLLGVPKKEKPKKIEDPIREANRALNSGDFDTAIEILKTRLTEMKGWDPATLILLTRAYLYNGQFDQAKRVVNQLLKKDKNSAAGWYWLAKIENAMGRWGAATQHLDRATKLLPSFVDAFCEKGLILLANKRYKEADEAFSEALRYDTRNARAWLGKAKALAGMDRWGAAIQAADRFISLIPDSREGWLFKAELLLDKGRYQDAERAYAKYLDMEPSDAKAWCGRGVALHSMGLTDDAEKCFQKCLEFEPGNERANHWLKVISGGGSAD
ncbi:MAG: tetratricopeptide repeat protein [Thermoplasmata archaeon]